MKIRPVSIKTPLSFAIMIGNWKKVTDFSHGETTIEIAGVDELPCGVDAVKKLFWRDYLAFITENLDCSKADNDSLAKYRAKYTA